MPNLNSDLLQKHNALGPTHPHIQRVQGIYPGCKVAGA
jgi:hypothetical protein